LALPARKVAFRVDYRQPWLPGLRGQRMDDGSALLELLAWDLVAPAAMNGTAASRICRSGST